MDLSIIKFDEKGLVPAVAQENSTGEVLMVAYMNPEALEKTLSTRRAHYYSRSRKTLWKKGETSGHFQDVEGVYYDCDSDTILLIVRQTGAACHTGERTCFFRRLDEGPATPAPAGVGIITGLQGVIASRQGADPDSSYVASLFEKGTEKILDKVAEESAELIEAARGGKTEDIVHELSDLWFHTLVLLGQKDIDVEEVYSELRRRFGTSGIIEKQSREKKSRKKK
jgi:phosphoribosyl-ATP pyrophosphohydrolase/phosphoribosyl-AMP cyclohydrolase